MTGRERRAARLAVYLMMLFALAACGGGAMSKGAASPESPAPDAMIVAGMRGAPAPEAPSAPGFPAGGGAAPAMPAQAHALAPSPATTTAEAPHNAGMLIYTANLSLAVFQVERGLDAVERIGRDVGGYLSSREDTAVTIRVPRERFDEALQSVEALGDVLHREVHVQDVTDEYVDIEARLKNAYAMRDRLKELLARAAVKEAIDIETQLGRVTEEIERLEGKLKVLRDRIAFSTITATFAPVAAEPVRDTALLPFPWMQDIGLSSLLDVHPEPQ